MRGILAFLLISMGFAANATGQQPTATVTLVDSVVAAKSRIGIGINGGGGWYNFVGANLVDDSSFEGPEQDDGFAKHGWPWYGSGTMSANVDVNDGVTGSQSQRIVVTGAPASMNQGRTALSQAPLVMQARSGHTYRIRVQAKTNQAGARIRLGVLNQDWQRVLGDTLALTAQWQIYEWDYQPSSDHLLRGIAVGFDDNATYWLDDLVAWDVGDYDAATGLSATFVQRLQELHPASLRLGGLGVNGIPLESYLRPGWDPAYGPPVLQPDLDLNTFLRLCQEVGASPFITVPPAFSDATHWQSGDLTDDVLQNIYVDHGNLIDYIGGDDGTSYGARRTADGLARWDQQFTGIYFELGNELWGTPDGAWDMNISGTLSQQQQMQNYATYCQRRMNEMRNRPGWRANMKVGFAGRGPTTWIGDWPGSYNQTLVPVIGSLTDFSTIDLYYGAGAASNSDDDIFAALFAFAPKHLREIASMKAAFAAANNDEDIETAVYEGNATWGGYQNDLSNPSPLYFKSVSLGAAVSLVDVYASSNLAGVTVNNHFHYAGNIWGATGPYPDVMRKPAFYALQLFTKHITGDVHACSVDGSTTYNSTLADESDIPYLGCYAYKQGTTWYLLLVNRHLHDDLPIRIEQRLAPMQRISLTGDDPNLNNEDSQTVALQTEQLTGQLVDEISEVVPPHSAVVLVLSETGEALTDAGHADTHAGSDTVGSDVETAADHAVSNDSVTGTDDSKKDELIGAGCNCAHAHSTASIWSFVACLIALRKRLKTGTLR